MVFQINWALGVEVDAVAFEHDLGLARHAVRAKPTAPDARARLRAALDLYRGDLLEDEDAGDWHLEERDRLRRLWTGGLATLGARLTAEGSHADAVDVYRSSAPTSGTKWRIAISWRQWRGRGDGARRCGTTTTSWRCSGNRGGRPRQTRRSRCMTSFAA